MKKISLIIPAYNTEAFITQCLQSVQDQSYTDLEVIVIDDGSTDSTRQKILSFTQTDERFRLLINEQPKGVAYSRNLGFSHATGTFIYFLDSDDFLHSEALHDLIIHSHDQAVITGRMLQSKKSDRLEYEVHEPIEYSVKQKKSFKNRSILHRLIRRDIITEQPFNETYRYFSDLELIIQILNNTAVIMYVKSAIYFKRRRAVGEGIAVMQEPLEGKIKQLSLI
jgi:CDP-glycerol glycerophosphotransferase